MLGRGVVRLTRDMGDSDHSVVLDSVAVVVTATAELVVEVAVVGMLSLVLVGYFGFASSLLCNTLPPPS